MPIVVVVTLRKCREVRCFSISPWLALPPPQGKSIVSLPSRSKWSQRH